MRYLSRTRLEKEVTEGERERDGDIQEKSILIKGVAVELDSAEVPQDFEDTAEDHGDHEGPCLEADAESEVGDDGDGVDAEEDEVAAETGDVGDCGEGDGAGFFGALGGVGYSRGERGGCGGHFGG